VTVTIPDSVIAVTLLILIFGAMTLHHEWRVRQARRHLDRERRDRLAAAAHEARWQETYDRIWDAANAPDARARVRQLNEVTGELVRFPGGGAA
jgi:hypothetical protein